MKMIKKIVLSMWRVDLKIRLHVDLRVDMRTNARIGAKMKTMKTMQVDVRRVVVKRVLLSQQVKHLKSALQKIPRKTLLHRYMQLASYYVKNMCVPVRMIP